MEVHGSCPRSVPTLRSETVQIASTRSCLPSFAVNQIVATLSTDMGRKSPDQRDRALNEDVQKKQDQVTSYLRRSLGDGIDAQWNPGDGSANGLQSFDRLLR